MVRTGDEPVRESQLGRSAQPSWVGPSCAPATSRCGSLNDQTGYRLRLTTGCAPATSRCGSLNIDKYFIEAQGMQVRTGDEPVRESQRT